MSAWWHVWWIMNELVMWRANILENAIEGGFEVNVVWNPHLTDACVPEKLFSAMYLMTCIRQQLLHRKLMSRTVNWGRKKSFQCLGIVLRHAWTQAPIVVYRRKTSLQTFEIKNSLQGGSKTLKRAIVLLSKVDIQQIRSKTKVLRYIRLDDHKSGRPP